MSSEQHENRQLGGYKATLHNPNTSEEAKAHAVQVLEAHGVSIDKRDSHEHDTHHEPKGQHAHAHAHGHEKAGQHDKEAEQRHENHVLGGYKATLHNPNTSTEAKEHAEKVLKDAGAL